MTASRPAPWTMAQLAQAAERGQLELHYQPIVDLRRGAIASAEGFNSAIQLIKANARGFRNFTNYRARILFHCGKLDLAMA